MEQLHQSHLQGFSVDRMNLFNLIILLYSYMEGKLNLCDFTTTFLKSLDTGGKKNITLQRDFQNNLLKSSPLLLTSPLRSW